MYIQASKFIGLPVGELENNSKVAHIINIFVDPKNQQIIGFFCKLNKTFFASKKILSINDVLDYDTSAVIVRSEEELLEIKEVVKIKKLIDKKIFFFGMKTRTESGQYLGKVDDFVFEIKKLKISKYYVNLFFHEKILPANKVVKIDEDKREIIFSDSILKPTKLKQTKKTATQKVAV